MSENVLKQQIDSKTYDVVVKDDGMFWIRISEAEEFEAPTLKGLMEKARGALRERKRPAVDCTLLEEDHWHNKGKDRLSFVDAQVTGIHAGNGNILIRREGGRSEQFSSYNTDLLRRLTSGERARLKDLYAAKERAAKEYEDLKGKLKMDAAVALKGEEK